MTRMDHMDRMDQGDLRDHQENGNKRRVVFVMEDLCFGGTQRQTLQLAQRLNRDKYVPVMLTLTGETDLDEEARSHGIEVHHMGSSREVDTLFFLRLLHRIRNLAPDILVPCTALPNIWGRIWGRWLQKVTKRPLGIVGTVRGGGAIVRQYEKRLWSLCDHMICNSTELREELRFLGVPAERLTYIPNGVDTERFAPVEPAPALRSPCIVCVARLCEDKDHATLIRAFERVYAANNSARLIMVGDGPWQERVHNQVASSNAQYGITMQPGQQDVRPWLAQASVFALSSVREGQPNVLMEAMACGLPVCATNVGGIPNLIEHNVNGLLSPSGDDAALAENILRILEDAQLSQKMSQANVERMRKDFSFAAMVQAHELIFDSFVDPSVDTSVDSCGK